MGLKKSSLLLQEFPYQEITSESYNAKIDYYLDSDIDIKNSPYLNILNMVSSHIFVKIFRLFSSYLKFQI